MYPNMKIFLLLFPLAAAADKVHEKLYGVVGAGNYTYYSLHQEGSVTIILTSLEDGDADLYVTDRGSHPTFDLDNHVYQSVTCGLDMVEIPRSSQRPLAIGVYGHPSKHETKYSLEVIIDDVIVEEIDYFPEDSYDKARVDSAAKPTMPQVPSKHKRKPDVADDTEEQSIIWNIIVGILKILLEVITN